LKHITTHISFLGTAVVLFTAHPQAQPVFGSSLLVEGYTLFPDKKKGNLYYAMPPDYQLLTDAGGKPALSLVKMRYTGSAGTGDAGVIKYSNLLQFRVGAGKQHLQKIGTVRAALKRKNPSSELRTLPVKKFVSVLVFTPAAPEPGSDTVNLVKGGIDESGEEGAGGNNNFWNERTVTVRLSNTDAQLVEYALRNGKTLMSFSYAFYSSFADRTDLRTEVYGNPRLRNEVRNLFDKDALTGADTSLFITPVKADAIPLSADPVQWPDVVREVDINERMPAKYPLFDVYCYDFAQGLRADLWEKKIEIKASGVNGSVVQYGFSFREDRPEVYARAIRFPLAVRFDKPFFYRVTEIDQNGNTVTTDWKEKTNWSELLDITTSPDKVVMKAKPDSTDQ